MKYLNYFFPQHEIVDMYKRFITDPHDEIVEAIGSDPDTPGVILTNIVEGKNKKGWLAVAKNKAAPDKLLQKLMEKTQDDFDTLSCLPELHEAIAANPNISDTTIELLLKDGPKNRSIVPILASHSEVTIERLRELFEKYRNQSCESLISNPKTPWDILRSILKDNILSRDDTPEDVFWLYADSEDEEIQKAIAKSKNTPSKLLDQLATCPIPEVRIAVASNPSLSKESFEKLLDDDDWRVKYAALQNPGIPTELCEDEKYIVSVFHYSEEDAKNLPPERDCSEMQEMVASNHGASPKALRIIFQQKNNATRTFYLIAKNPNTPDDVVISLTDSPFTKDIVSGDYGEDAVRELMLQDKHILAEIANRKKLPPLAIERLLKDNDACLNLAENKHVELEVLRRLAGHPDEEVRKRVAANTNTSEGDLELLGKDAFWCVREAALKNANTSYEVRKSIAKDKLFQLYLGGKTMERLAEEAKRGCGFHM